MSNILSFVLKMKFDHELTVLHQPNKLSLQQGDFYFVGARCCCSRKLNTSETFSLKIRFK